MYFTVFKRRKKAHHTFIYADKTTDHLFFTALLMMASSSQAGLTVVPSWWGITVVHKSLCFLPCSKKSSSHALTW